MAGRRIRKQVKQVLTDNLPEGECDEVHVTIAGLANSYSGYITTREEYQLQRYEAAAVMYGPNTLQAHIQELSRLAKDIATGANTTTGSPPHDDLDEQLYLVPPPKLDMCPWSIWKGSGGTSCFGDVIKDASATEYYGREVRVKFQGANPRNNLRLGGTYMTLERVLEDDKTEVLTTEVLMTDSDYITNFKWKAKSSLLHRLLTGAGCEGNYFDRLRSYIRKLKKNGQTLFTNCFTQGATNDNKPKSLIDPLLHFFTDIGTAKNISVNEYMCLGGGETVASEVELVLFLPQADTREDLLYHFDKTPLRLCYHGDYMLEPDQKPIPFTGCSRKFTVSRDTPPTFKSLILWWAVVAATSIVTLTVISVVIFFLMKTGRKKSRMSVNPETQHKSGNTD